MASIHNIASTSVRSPSQSPSPIKRKPVEALVESDIQTATKQNVGVASAPASVAQSIRASSPTPPAPQSEAGSHAAKSVASRSTELKVAVASARAEGFSALFASAKNNSAISRSITKYMTAAGIGLAFGLLCCGQPVAAMFMIPVFFAVGAGLAFAMKTLANSKPNASLEAFKDMVKNPTELEKSHPDFAKAQALNAFLTDGFASFVKARGTDIAGGLRGALANSVNNLKASMAAAASRETDAVETANKGTSTKAASVAGSVKSVKDIAGSVAPASEASEPTIARMQTRDSFVTARQTQMTAKSDTDGSVIDRASAHPMEEDAVGIAR